MANETSYSYSIVEVSKEQVLSKIQNYGYTILAVKIEDNETLNCDTDVTIKQLKSMLNGSEYLYFHVKKKEVSTGA